jgi:uncharacterized membrane protein
LQTIIKTTKFTKNSVTGVIYYVIAVIAVAVAIGALVFGFATILLLGFGILAFIGGLVVAFIFYILAAQRLKKTFDTLAEKSGEQSFRTAGTLLWWGAILTIVFVGLILIFIAWIFATMAFFSMKLQSQQPSTSQQYGYTPPPAPQAAQTSPTVQVTRFCPNCGAPVQPNTTFCPNCGKQLTA